MYYNDNMQQRRSPNPSTTNTNTSQQQSTSAIPSLVTASVGSYVFETGKQRAKAALNIYSHIDYLRPYFDVEPKDVLNRLINSLVPIEKTYRLVTELYGPTMIIFTLSAIIIYQMKMSNHAVQDGTLIGTAFFVCFSYWVGLSGIMTSLSFICSSTITLFNYLSIIGYSMFSHCVVLLIGTFIHTHYDHVIFYVLWLVLGGAAALKMAYLIFVNTPHPSYRIGIALFATFMHLGFLLYLHFAYHELAEEVQHALFDKQTDLPNMLIMTKSIDSAAEVKVKQTAMFKQDKY